MKANGIEVTSVWESEKHRTWCMPVEGFKGHVATDGSLSGKAGKWRACGWAVVQLDCDEGMGPWRGMYGSVETELEVQRTIKGTELTAFLCILKRVIGQSGSMLTTRELSMDYEQEKASVQSQEREMLIYGYKFGQNFMVWHTEAFWWKWSM